MKLAFCLFIYFPYGGLQRDFLNIAKTCLQHGHQVDVFTMEWQGEQPKDLNIHIVPRVGFSSHRRCMNFSHYLQEFFLKTPYDVIIGFNKVAGLNVYFAADVCFKAKLQDSWRRYFGRYKTFCRLEAEIFAPHSLTEILYISEMQKSTYQDTYNTPEERWHFVMPSIDPSRFKLENKSQARQKIRAEFNLAPQTTLLLAVGSGFKAKGLDRSLEAIAALTVAQREQLVFLIAGQNSAAYFKRLVKRLKLSAQVKFLGGREDIPDLLLAADFLLHPAYLESGGIVLIEALLCGLPVLATDGSGFSHHIQQADAGLVLARDASQRDFNEALNTLLNSGKKALWQNNALRYRQQSNFASIGEQAVAIIEATAQQPHFPMITQRQAWQNYVLSLRKDFYQAFQHPTIFAAINLIQGQIYRAVAQRETLAFAFQQKNYFIKRHYGIGWLEIFKNLAFLRWPILGATTEFRSIRRLEQLGIDTLKVVGFGKKGWNPANQHSFLISEALENTLSLEDFCRAWPQSPPPLTLKRALIKKVAQIARILHRAGVNHRDFYICHFLLQLKADGSVDPQALKLYLIDLHRMQQHKKLPQRWLIKDLAGLYFSTFDISLSQRDIYYFLKEYTQAPLLQLKAQNRFWQRIQQRASTLYAKPLRG